MVAPLDLPWLRTDGSDANLNKTTYGQGTSFPSTWAVDRIFWRTDTNLIYKNTGTVGTPIWSLLSVVGQSGDQQYPLSITIGDYSSPTAAVSTSDGAATNTYDFATDPWTKNDAGKVVVSGGVTTITVTEDSTNDAAVIDLGAGNVSDTLWCLDFDYKVTAQTSAETVLFGISSHAETVDYATAQDWIGMWHGTNTQNILQASDSDGASPASGQENSTAFAAVTSTQYYGRIRRTSPTAYKIDIYSDASRTTNFVNVPSTAVASTTVGLRYIKYMNAIITAAGTSTIVIDNIKFYNGQSLPFEGSSVKDNDTATKWKSLSENNPAIYVDTGSAQEIIGLAIMFDKTFTTETQITVRTSTDTTFDSTEDVRLLNIADFTDDVYRFISIPRVPIDKRYIQIRGVSNAVTLSIWEIKYRVKTSAILNREHFHKYLSPTDANANSLDSN